MDRKGDLAWSQVFGVVIVLLLIAFVGFYMLPKVFKSTNALQDCTKIGGRCDAACADDEHPQGYCSSFANGPGTTFNVCCVKDNPGQTPAPGTPAVAINQNDCQAGKAGTEGNYCLQGNNPNIHTQICHNSVCMDRCSYCVTGTDKDPTGVCSDGKITTGFSCQALPTGKTCTAPDCYSGFCPGANDYCAKSQPISITTQNGNEPQKTSTSAVTPVNGGTLDFFYGDPVKFSFTSNGPLGVKCSVALTRTDISPQKWLAKSVVDNANPGFVDADGTKSFRKDFSCGGTDAKIDVNLADLGTITDSGLSNFTAYTKDNKIRVDVITYKSADCNFACQQNTANWAAYTTFTVRFHSNGPVTSTVLNPTNPNAPVSHVCPATCADIPGFLSPTSGPSVQAVCLNPSLLNCNYKCSMVTDSSCVNCVSVSAPPSDQANYCANFNDATYCGNASSNCNVGSVSCQWNSYPFGIGLWHSCGVKS